MFVPTRFTVERTLFRKDQSVLRAVLVQCSTRSTDVSYARTCTNDTMWSRANSSSSLRSKDHHYYFFITRSRRVLNEGDDLIEISLTDQHESTYYCNAITTSSNW